MPEERQETTETPFDQKSLHRAIGDLLFSELYYPGYPWQPEEIERLIVQQCCDTGTRHEDKIVAFTKVDLIISMLKGSGVPNADQLVCDGVFGEEVKTALAYIAPKPVAKERLTNPLSALGDCGLTGTNIPMWRVSQQKSQPK